MEEKKVVDFFKPAAVKAGRKTVVVPKPSEELVTPELLLTQFNGNYTLCAAMQKRSVRKSMESTAKKLENKLHLSREQWNTTLNLLLQKKDELKDVLESHSNEVTCPASLHGIPAQQLDQLERLVFWGKVVVSSHSGNSSLSVTRLQELLSEVSELQVKVKQQELQLEKMSQEVVSCGIPQQAFTKDVVTYNNECFQLQDVLSKSVYNPPFEHNDVYHFFTTIHEVLQFHASLQERCVRDRLVPPWRGFAKLFTAPIPTVEELGQGFFVGLVVITNMSDVSNGNHDINLDNMCVSVSEQLSGTCLQPGKKYVTWYLGQYDKDRPANKSSRQWADTFDQLFMSVQQSPAAWNSEFVKGWKSSLAESPGSYKPMYTCVLPGTKEVTLSSWSSTDTLDWIVRNVHFWAHQLNTYAPFGYNVPLNNHFHRSVFLEIPGLVKFPVLWQYKKALSDMLTLVKDKFEVVNAQVQVVLKLLVNMKQSFFDCNFDFLHPQWSDVMQQMQQVREVMAEFLNHKNKLQLMSETIVSSVPTKVRQAEAMSSLYGIELSGGIERYQNTIQLLLEQVSVLLQTTDLVFLLPVTLSDMEEFQVYTDALKCADRAWVLEMCTLVKVSVSDFFEHFAVILKRVKAARVRSHPDWKKNSQNLEPHLKQYYDCQASLTQLEAIKKLHENFFIKVRL